LIRVDAKWESVSAKAKARDPDGRQGGPLRLLFLAVGAAGLLASLVTGYLLVRGPFLGGPPLEPVPLLWATGGFLLGIIVFAFGAAKAAGVGVRG
jgi:hypothetical protein